MTERHPTKIYDPAALDKLARDAADSPRRRAALPIHDDFAEPVQRVLMVAEPDTFVGPHRHPDKGWEMIVLLEGAMELLLFSDDGVLQERVALSAAGNRVIEYAADAFHAAVILEPGTLVLEAKEGPYVAETAKEIPAWAAEENSAGAEAFFERMRALEPGERIAAKV